MKILMITLFLLLSFGCSPAPESKPPEISTDAAYEAKLSEVEKKAEQVTLGMARSKVELLFLEKDGGAQTLLRSRYYEHPEVMIEIPFDRTGGNGNANNRVTGLPMIYRSHRHID